MRCVLSWRNPHAALHATPSCAASIRPAAPLARAPGMLRAVHAHCAASQKSSTLAGMGCWLDMLGMLGLELLVLRAWAVLSSEATSGSAAKDPCRERRLHGPAASFCPPSRTSASECGGRAGLGEARGLLRGHGEVEAGDALPEGRAVEGIHAGAVGSIETGLSPPPQVRHLAQERRRRHLQGRCRRSQRWSGERGEDERALATRGRPG